MSQSAYNKFIILQKRKTGEESKFVCVNTNISQQLFEEMSRRKYIHLGTLYIIPLHQFDLRTHFIMSTSDSKSISFITITFLSIINVYIDDFVLSYALIPYNICQSLIDN